MGVLTKEIMSFFQNQGFVIVSTIDDVGMPHNSCKDIIKIGTDDKVYFLDLYRARTFKNLHNNPKASITAVDEHKFKGYCLKGKTQIVESDKLGPDIFKAWENKIAGRATNRLLKNMRGEKGHSFHPETRLPRPQYMIALQVEEVVDLTPHKLR
jgi:uncharacterized pyridoxamine 5'-phosphate oxidase family protein